jgi:hypothetical protein
MEEKKQKDSSESEDTEEYELDKSDNKDAQELKKKLQEKWDKMEAEKAAILKKAQEEKKALKRKHREDEERKLAKFQKIDPHFNPKLRHAKRQIKKLKTSPPPAESTADKEASKELPPFFRAEAVDKLKQIQTDIVKLVEDHLPNEKSEFGFLNKSLKDIVEMLQKDVISYYSMGLINFSVKAIMYMAGISASDCKEGIESVKIFTELLSAMCEIVVEENNHIKSTYK